MSTAATALTIEREDTKAITPRSEPLPASETAAIFQIIERAARDQTVDIDKMKELVAMRNQMRAEEAELEFDGAMAAAQEEMEPVRADANNPQTKSKYASYAALDRAIRPVYTKHGFSVTFDTGDSPLPEHVRVIAKVAHRGGHRDRPHIDMPADGKGAKGGDVMTRTHATGSAVQYGRRYLLGMIFNLAVAKDDDGNGASVRDDSGPIDADELKRIQNLIEKSGADTQLFCERWKIEALPDLTKRTFKEAYASLSRWHESNQRAAK